MANKKHLGLIAIVIAALFVTILLAGCTSSSTGTSPQNSTAAQAPAVSVNQSLVIATTTSLYDTGLLNYLQPIFENQTNIKLLITEQGTGKAIAIAKNGDADVLLVHAPAQELAFMKGGYGLNRRSFASNYFEIVGPGNDPAGIANMTANNAFSTILLKGTNIPPVLFSCPVVMDPGPRLLKSISGQIPGIITPMSRIPSVVYRIWPGNGCHSPDGKRERCVYPDRSGNVPCVPEQPHACPAGYAGNQPAQYLQCHGSIQCPSAGKQNPGSKRIHQLPPLTADTSRHRKLRCAAGREVALHTHVRERAQCPRRLGRRSHTPATDLLLNPHQLPRHSRQP